MKEQTHISVLSELIDTAEMSSLAATLPTMQRDQQQQLTMADCPAGSAHVSPHREFLTCWLRWHHWRTFIRRHTVRDVHLFCSFKAVVILHNMFIKFKTSTVWELLTTDKTPTGACCGSINSDVKQESETEAPVGFMYQESLFSSLLTHTHTRTHTHTHTQVAAAVCPDVMPGGCWGSTLLAKMSGCFLMWGAVSWMLLCCSISLMRRVSVMSQRSAAGRQSGRGTVQRPSSSHRVKLCSF